ncbi:MAG: sigma 54-interacting transcriptional regulator [candidate division FCPU426 bacterium]
MPKKILIVDDEAEPIEIYKELFTLKGYEVEQAKNAKETLEKIETFSPDLVTLDINFGHGQEAEGVNIVKLIRDRWNREELPILMVSGYGTSVDFLDAKENGANAVVLKSKVEDVLHKAEELLWEQDASKQEAMPLPDRMRGRGTNENIIKLLDWADQESDVLILGETGTGKNLAAETYRRASRRRDRFYRVNLANISGSLIQVELFGSVRGAFTGAIDRKGMLEEADKGILFLDEVGELPLEQQQNLLDFMDTHEIRRVGSNQPIKLDLIILAATRQDLPKLAQTQEFRPDLFRRLWHNHITMPPLRTIPEDIPLLADGFIQQFNQKYHKRVAAIEPEVLRLFQKLPWYGNTGELRFCISHGVLNCKGSMIRREDIEGFLRPEYLSIFNGSKQAGLTNNQVMVVPRNEDVSEQPATIRDLRKKQRSEEKELVETIFNKCDRNQTQAAKMMGVSRERFIQLLKKHEII